MPRALFTRCQPLSFTSFVCVDRWTGRNLTVRLPLDWLVVATAVVLGAVREEPVNDESDDREDEDEETPEKLVAGRAVGFDDFNYGITNDISTLFGGPGWSDRKKQVSTHPRR
jgi:hypothetical protein